jgi:hypothetical protein
LVPPAVRPVTRKRWATRKITSTGATDSSVASTSSGGWTSALLPTTGLKVGVADSIWVSPTCIGYWPLPGSITYGRKKLFQFPTKLKKPTRATTGAASGSAMLTKARNSPAPSMRAAASRSADTAVEK